MNRITPSDVLEAYQKTGIKPGRFTAHAESGACCGLGALAVLNGMPGNPYGFAIRHYGSEYTTGFMVGFDWQAAPKDSDSDRMKLGYSDGLACAAAVFGEPSA